VDYHSFVHSLMHKEIAEGASGTAAVSFRRWKLDDGHCHVFSGSHFSKITGLGG
jgi:hypothetical protein